MSAFIDANRRGPDSAANLVTLRADVAHLFAEGVLTFAARAPRLESGEPDSDSDEAHYDEPARKRLERRRRDCGRDEPLARRLARREAQLVCHVLRPRASSQLVSLYHGRPLRRLDGVTPEFLLARFAYALFDGDDVLTFWRDEERIEHGDDERGERRAAGDEDRQVRRPRLDEMRIRSLEVVLGEKYDARRHAKTGSVNVVSVCPKRVRPLLTGDPYEAPEN